MVLSTEEKRERHLIACKKYREKNKEKISIKAKKYNANPINKERDDLKKKEYRETPHGRKIRKLQEWKSRGLIASKEEKDRIYNLYLTQEFCNACDCILTRNRDNSKTDANMDHDHSNGKFRHIICHGCNTSDSWKKHFC